MPFDETPDNGGGGGGGGDNHRHDPQRMYEMADGVLRGLSIACEVTDLCEFHTGMTMQVIMIDGLVKTVRKHVDDKKRKAAALNMCRMELDTLQTMQKKLEEEIAKHG